MTTAHETSDAFSDETLREQAVFQHAKKAEMKEMLGRLADGQTEMYKAVRNPSAPSQRWSDMLFLAEHGGMGENHPYNTAYTRGRVASNSEDLGIFSDVCVVDSQIPNVTLFHSNAFMSQSISNAFFIINMLCMTEMIHNLAVCYSSSPSLPLVPVDYSLSSSLSS